MKRNILLLLSLCCMTISCMYPDGMSQDTLKKSDDYESVIMIMPQMGYDDSENLTKNVAYIGSNVEFVWSVTDSVGIFPDAGSQIYFSMASGAGQVSAAFDGGGWALKKNAEYYSYFPFIPNFYIHKNSVPLTYVGQTQRGNAQENLADIGKYGYMIAKGIADETTGSLYFNYERLGNLFRIKIPVLPGNYTSLTVKTDEDILVQSGTYNVVDMNYSIDNPIYGNSLTLSLEDVTFEQNGNLVAFIMMAPFDYLNHQLTFELTDSEGNIAVSSVRGKTYERGMTYGNTPHLSIYPSNIFLECTASSYTFNIIDSGTHTYSVRTETPWINLNNSSNSGNASVTISVNENPDSINREGQIIVSETVNGILLQNIVNVLQAGSQIIGGGSDSGGFEDND